jgi:excisionase family DNA binding protein
VDGRHPPVPTATHLAIAPHADPDVLVAPEVARLLRMNVKTVYELAKAGDLPCWRLGRHFRFSMRAIVARLGQCRTASHREGK